MKNGIVEFEVRLKGAKPLLMANPQMANPLNQYKKEASKYTGKKNKTDEDHIALSKIHFMGHLYYDEEIGFFIPSENIEACIKNGAKVSRKGKDIPLAVNVVEYKVPLIHRSNAKTPEELYNDNDFVDVRLGSTGGRASAKILITRPRFDQWELVFHVELDTTVLDIEDFIEALNNAGQRHGLGTYRPRYGTFEAIVKQIG